MVPCSGRKPKSLSRSISLPALLFVCLVFYCADLHANDGGTGFLTVSFDNDKWGDDTDGQYTHGSQFRYHSARPMNWLGNVAGHLPCAPCRDPEAVTYEFGQSIYTPNNTWSPSLVAEDRPYAGWLYMGARLHTETETRNGGVRSDAIGLTLGIIGPAALADKAQAFFHEQRELMVPQGWQHQLDNEPGLVLDYTRGWRRGLYTDSGFGIDAEPFLTGAIGNVHTYLGAGVSIRSGLNLRAGKTEKDRFAAGLHLFVTLEARGVARNIFLDGNTWAESHSVEKRPLVGRARAGIRYASEKVEIVLAHTLRSREFYGQLEPDRYGSVSISYRP